MCALALSEKNEATNEHHIFFNFVKSVTETCEMIESAHGDNAMSRSRVFEWFLKF